MDAHRGREDDVDDDEEVSGDSPQNSRRFLSQPWRRRTPEEGESVGEKAQRCWRKTPRYLFFFFNAVLLLFGGAVLGASLWIRGQTAEFFEIERDESDMVALLETVFECMLGVGATFFGVALFGLVSECAREPLCLIVYILMLTTFLLCQLIPVCTFIEHSRHYGDQVKGWMTQTLHDKYIGANPTGEHRNAYSFVFDALNMVLQCCGVNNGSDFVDRTDGYWKQNKLMEIGFEFTYPATCCKMNRTADFKTFTAVNRRCLFEPNFDNTWKDIGCFQRIEEGLAEKSTLLIGVFVGFVVWQAICVILAGIQVWKIRAKEAKFRVEESGRRKSKRRYEEYEKERFREEF